MCVCVCVRSRRFNVQLICFGDSSESLAAPGEDLPVPPNTRASSPQTLAQEQDLPMPPSEPIPPQHAQTANRWKPVCVQME